MITNKTPEQIAALGQTIAAAADQLEAIMAEVAIEADTKLAAKAREFVAAYEDPSRDARHLDCGKAREALLKAAIAASNLRDLTSRSVTLHSKCDWWRSFSRQTVSDINLVCSGVQVQAVQARQPHPGSVWLEEHATELPVNQWVAATADGLVAHDPDLDVVLQKVAAAGLQVSQVATMFAQESGPAIIRQ